MERPNAWKKYGDEELRALEEVSAGYRCFLDSGKTERECAAEVIRQAEAAGFTDLAEAVRKDRKLQPGDRLYSVCMGKAVCLFILGNEGPESGMNIVGAHIDSPRIDVKQNPLYEDSGLALLDTHYYGGIKKYQWVTIPLALHGVVCLKDGTRVEVRIGEDEDDPVLTITDLLIHLSAAQMEKPAAKAVEGENLDLLVGGRPLSGEEKEPVRAMVLKALRERFGMDEEDFLSAELEAVPAGKTRELGLDRSMLLGYGHDDRVCAYAALKAMLEITDTPEKTCCCIFADKEEIGSVGATGMQARYFENAAAELLALMGKGGDLPLRRMLAASRMLSCDVSAGFDPLYASAFEKKNAAFLGRGVCFNKFTGARGKSGSNDANPEFIARLRAILDDDGVAYQTAELGRVDVGGGGTIAYICALYGMEVIDSGVPVLSMHAPWEVISKADLYEAVRGYGVFMRKA